VIQREKTPEASMGKFWAYLGALWWGVGTWLLKLILTIKELGVYS
jgi:hypothetical protein